MKRQTKAAIRDILKAGGITFWVCVAVICLIVVNYGDENSDNTYTISGIVTDVKLHYSRNTRLVEFKINGIQCYYKLADSEHGATKEDVYNFYLRLEKQGKTITALVSKDWDSDKLEFDHQVVDIIGEKDKCFSLESHNVRQRGSIIVFSIPPVTIILLLLVPQIKIAYREIIIPTRKRRKRKKRELERQELLEEHPEGIPPKQSKELSRAKNRKNKKRRKG